jgi:N-acetyl-anhydromuramyl-L-alanine amidase AmpD
MRLVVVNPPLSTSPRPSPASIIVLHATAGSTARSSIDWLRAQGLSYHYIIARNTADSASTSGAAATEPTVFQLAETRFRTAHVGSGIPMPGPAGMTANRVGVGISLSNRQNGEAYMPMQLTALDEVIKLVKQITPTITHITTHGAIQPWNRKDPLNVIGTALATKHGLIWFQPTPAQVAAHTPNRVGRPRA